MIENKGILEIKRMCAKYTLSPIELSMHINILPVRIYEIMSGKRRITIDTDLRLCKFFKVNKRHFVDMQIDYDMALEEVKLADRLRTIKTVDDIVKKK